MSKARDLANLGTNTAALATDSEVSAAVAPKLNADGFWAAGRNKILNGDFGIWQRGTSFNKVSTFDFHADRWITVSDGTASYTVTRQTFTPGTAPVAGYEAPYFCRLAVASASGASAMKLVQRVEDVRTLAGQTATVSFWAKADASRNVDIFAYRAFGTGGSATDAVAFGTAAVTTVWQRFSFTVSMPSVAGKTIGAGSNLELNLAFPVNTPETIDIWGVQLEAGTVATPFTTATGNPASELAACQRYYYRDTNPTATYALYGDGYGITTTAAQFVIDFPCTMRVAPGIIEYSTLAVGVFGISPVAVSSLAIETSMPSKARVQANVASGLTVNQSYALTNNNNVNGYLAFSAEL